MISEAILIPKIYARLQEIASNFSKFYGEAPQTPPPALDSGLRRLTGPLSKIPGSAPELFYISHHIVSTAAHLGKSKVQICSK